MVKAIAQDLAHELTIEYIHVHPEILSVNMDNIEKAVDTIADINIKFYEALTNNSKFNKTYL